MRRLALALGVIGIAGALLVPSTDAAGRQSRFTFHIDQTVPAGGLSSACGFPVFVHFEGTTAANLFFDSSGVLTREIDTNPNLTVTFFAPSTGRSFSYHPGLDFVQDYSNGTAIGSHVLATQSGFQGATGSGPPDAGRLVIDGVIVDVLPEGIPIVQFVDVISVSGHFNDDFDAARCTALSGP